MPDRPIATPSSPSEDPTSFAALPGTSVRLRGAGDATDLRVADWSVETLLELARKLKTADRLLDRAEERARRATYAARTDDAPGGGAGGGSQSSDASRSPVTSDDNASGRAADAIAVDSSAGTDASGPTRRPKRARFGRPVDPGFEDAP